MFFEMKIILVTPSPHRTPIFHTSGLFCQNTPSYLSNVRNLWMAPKITVKTIMLYKWKGNAFTILNQNFHKMYSVRHENTKNHTKCLHKRIIFSYTWDITENLKSDCIFIMPRKHKFSTNIEATVWNKVQIVKTSTFR